MNSRRATDPTPSTAHPARLPPDRRGRGRRTRSGRRTRRRLHWGSPLLQSRASLPARRTSPTAAPSPKRFLILGGTGFIGPHTVRYAVERGHEVTIFTRGRADADLPDVERLVGDRNGDLAALEGRNWDVVFDNNCQNYRWAQLSTELLKDAAEQYIFVSSISAYAIEGMNFQHKKDNGCCGSPPSPKNYARFEPPERVEGRGRRALRAHEATERGHLRTRRSRAAPP